LQSNNLALFQLRHNASTNSCGGGRTAVVVALKLFRVYVRVLSVWMFAVY